MVSQWKGLVLARDGEPFWRQVSKKIMAGSHVVFWAMVATIQTLA